MRQEVMNRFRQQLLEEKAATEHALTNLNNGLTQSLSDSAVEFSTYDNHPADVATETFERGKDLALREGEMMRLDEINSALARIKHGTYGWCEECGKAIPMERLQVVPEARFCLRCQKEHEDPVRDRPIEETVVNHMLRESFTDDAANENVEFDGEDSWQAVARYGTSNTPGDFASAERYDETYIDAGESIGIVFREEALPSSYDRSKHQFLKRASRVGVEKSPIIDTDRE